MLEKQINFNCINSLQTCEILHLYILKTIDNFNVNN